jgi:hypothetical protein
MKKYIFVLCPPYQGSTIILNLLSSSKNVSSFIGKSHWMGESHWLLKKHGDKNYESNRWDPNYNLDMNLVKKLFDIYLDDTKTIFIEKSPPTICRAKMFEEYFSGLGEVYFIISIRNPYSVRYGAEEWIKYAKFQRDNINTLNNIIVTSYEECCLDLDNVIKKIKEKIPHLGDIESVDNMRINNERGRVIHDKKVNRVIDKEKRGEVLKGELELLTFFKYKI